MEISKMWEMQRVPRRAIELWVRLSILKQSFTWAYVTASFMFDRGLFLFATRITDIVDGLLLGILPFFDALLMVAAKSADFDQGLSPCLESWRELAPYTNYVYIYTVLA